MEAVVPGTSIKEFAKILQTIGKIGEELYIETRTNRLILSTVNSSRSAFVVFTVQPEFFESYRCGNQNGGAATLTCRMLLRPILNIFKLKANVEAVEKCKIKLQVDEGSQDRLVIELICRFGVRKTHKLHYETCDALHAIYSKHTCTNKWVAPAAVFQEWIGSFHHKLEEVTIKVGNKTFGMKSFVEGVVGDGQDVKRQLQTEVTIEVQEFPIYQCGEEVELTFNLKEMKAILSFADSLGLDVGGYFDRAGNPITFAVTNRNLFTGDFVLATLSDVNGEGEQTQATQATQVSNTNGLSSQPQYHQQQVSAAPSRLSTQVNAQTNASQATERDFLDNNNDNDDDDEECPPSPPTRIPAIPNPLTSQSMRPSSSTAMGGLAGMPVDTPLDLGTTRLIGVPLTSQMARDSVPQHHDLPFMSSLPTHQINTEPASTLSKPVNRRKSFREAETVQLKQRASLLDHHSLADEEEFGNSPRARRVVEVEENGEEDEELQPTPPVKKVKTLFG